MLQNTVNVEALKVRQDLFKQLITLSGTVEAGFLIFEKYLVEYKNVFALDHGPRAVWIVACFAATIILGFLGLDWVARAMQGEGVNSEKFLLRVTRLTIIVFALGCYHFFNYCLAYV